MTEKMKKPSYSFGSIIKTSKKLVRKSSYSGCEGPWQKKYWEEEEIEEVYVIVLGTRTLYNGSVSFYEDEPTIFFPEEGNTVRAYLVCAKGKNPFYIKMEWAE